MSAFGHNRERQVKAKLEAQGYVVVRSPASLGVFDLVALSPSDRLLIEVKATAAGPFHSFGPEKRRDLIAAARQAGATATLAWWPKRKELVFIPATEWPDA